MNGNTDELLELLKVMKDLHGNGFHLSKEINAIIKVILINQGLTSEMIYGKKNNN